MRWLIWYIRSCFCKHEWEPIFESRIMDTRDVVHNCVKVFRCKKCGYSKRYKAMNW